MTKKFKVLIGYDGSEHSDLALDDLRTAGLPEDAEAFVVAVAEMWIPMPLNYGGVETSYVDDAVTGRSRSPMVAAGGADILKQIFPNWTIQHGEAVGSPSAILLEKADEWQPDLVVVGSRCHGVVARFFFGSVAQSLAVHAPCSVRIVRNAGKRIASEDNGPVRIVVGVDGSSGADAAVESIVGRNWTTGCKVRVVSAMDYLIPLKTFDLIESDQIQRSEFYREEREKAEINVSRAINALDQAGFTATSMVKNQDPKNLLVEQAEEWNADCIFVGARGVSLIERLLLGSVSSSVAARAQCTVEIVRRPLQVDQPRP